MMVMAVGCEHRETFTVASSRPRMRTSAVHASHVANLNSGSLPNSREVVSPNSAATARLVTIDQIGTNTFTVYINNGSFAPVNNDFVFMVTAR